jgi:hypothetical protein
MFCVSGASIHFEISNFNSATMCVKGYKMENTAWKGEGVSGQCCSTTATEGSPTAGADVDTEGSAHVPTITATAAVPWTSFCSLDMQQINQVGYSISSF